MKKLFIGYLFLFLSGFLHSQSIGTYSVQLTELEILEMPALQSYVHATHDGKWLLIGGRTDGLHRRQPWAAFWAIFQNSSVFVIDPANQLVYESPLAGLPLPLLEQLQSTNMQFHHSDSLLVMTGGYGYSASADDHVTYPFLSVVEISGLMHAVEAGEPIAPFFRQLEDERMQVTGGQMEKLGNTYYLVGGQKFMGRYNPMGPDHGPGFIQEYTNEIRKFQLFLHPQEIEITNYSAIRDSAQLHRRDYNMVPQIFPGGKKGMTVFSGVFQYEEDLPWLNTVDITEEGYEVNNDFSQYLNQYHTARLPVYLEEIGEMNTIFFGGISRYHFSEDNQLMDDPNVPFVNTISMVSRDAMGATTESRIGEMPALLGSGAEFIPAPDAPLDDMDIIHLHSNAPDSILAGYIVGGIESSAPNILFSDNDGSLSKASSRIFEVWLLKESASSIKGESLSGDNYFHIRLFPNPATDSLQLIFNNHKTERVRIHLVAVDGRDTTMLVDEMLQAGENEYHIDISDLTPGQYTILLSTDEFHATKAFSKFERAGIR